MTETEFESKEFAAIKEAAMRKAGEVLVKLINSEHQVPIKSYFCQKITADQSNAIYYNEFDQMRRLFSADLPIADYISASEPTVLLDYVDSDHIVVNSENKFSWWIYIPTDLGLASFGIFGSRNMFPLKGKVIPDADEEMIAKNPGTLKLIFHGFKSEPYIISKNGEPEDKIIYDQGKVPGVFFNHFLGNERFGLQYREDIGSWTQKIEVIKFGTPEKDKDTVKADTPWWEKIKGMLNPPKPQALPQ